MIGPFGDVYPINRDVFLKKYDIVDEAFILDVDYSPSVNDMDTNEHIELLPYAKSCITNGKGKIYAKALTKNAKIFTKWDYDKYMNGLVGDYICYTFDDEYDIYIIKKEVFKDTYELCQ